MFEIAATDTKLRDKLHRLVGLNDEDEAALSTLRFRTEIIGPCRPIIREGEKVTQTCLLVKGFACRDKMSRHGARQIVSFHIAGDLLDLETVSLPVADHNLNTISKVTVGWISSAELRDFIERHPRIASGLHRDLLIDASIYREWVLNVGRRDAKTRVAHMICEFVARRQAMGVSDDEAFELPFTQEQIADATGLTSVHVNRMLRVLREAGAFEPSSRHLRIADWQALQVLGDFRPAYLHQAA